ncbi:MAG: hypothetical protein H6726_04845 [Sandaracinaceae bacterium]|nr:hypothetical protein [Sandaracinaceae bacterium]
MRRSLRVSPFRSFSLGALAPFVAAVFVIGCAQSHASFEDGGARDTGGGGGVCAVAADCTLLPASCCGACGAPTASDMIAVRNEDVEVNRARACACGVGCPECFMQPDAFLLAVCAAGACEARDLRTDDLTVCIMDDDCQLAPRDCCGCGQLGLGDTIAFNPSRGSYGELVCDPRLICPPCAPLLDGLRAACVAGHCDVVEASAP